MKKIIKIAQTELKTLFYSPVAWLILIVFSFQAAMTYVDILSGYTKAQEMTGFLENLTLNFFSGKIGLFTKIQDYLYLYIPLLTMGLMSRELNSGSIKLLYSSPVTNVQIIIGKYLSMMFYGLILMAILFVLVIHASFSIQSFDFPVVLAGLLGLYLLLCTYAAIGLFMSSLTSYQVVAAIGTLAVLVLLNFIGSFWQDVEFVRDITYWLSIGGRANEFIRGLICSEDVLYFIIVTLLFLSLCILRLQANRQKSKWTVSWAKYAVAFVAAMMLGYVTSRPVCKAFCDVTRTKQRTLTQNSRDILREVKGGLTMTTYVNLLDDDYKFGLPKSRNSDMDRFQQYTRFKPEIKMKYVYYYKEAEGQLSKMRFPELSERERAEKMCGIEDIPLSMFMTPDEIDKIIDLKPENYRMVRLLERENGETTFLRMFSDFIRYPTESEISAALKRLVMKLPVVAFLSGHEGRSFEDRENSGYSRLTGEKSFRQALINQGFDFTTVTLEQDIPDDINILVISDIKTPLSPAAHACLDRYIARGGNLILLAEPRRTEYMRPIVRQFGVDFVPGVLVNTPSSGSRANIVFAKPTTQSGTFSYLFEAMRERKTVVSMPGCMGLTFRTDSVYKAVPLFTTGEGYWNELETTDFQEGIPPYNPEKGELKADYCTILSLSRQVNGGEQKIMIFGDADCLSNEEILLKRNNVAVANYSLIMGVFSWMSDGEAPIDVRRPVPPDNALSMRKSGIAVSRVLLVYVFPSILVLLSLLIWIRRRRR